VAPMSTASNLDFDRLLDGQVALITGAASGQGRAASLLFGRHGARIVVADVNDQGSAETVRLLEERNAEGMAVHADVSTRPRSSVSAASISCTTTRRCR
jgi:NAD(P)-dependent dehydrogenase (short-subunit alcohol dehydrogenase family)